VLLIDDHLAARALFGDAIDGSDELATTSCWWWRLGAASRREPPLGRLGAYGGPSADDRARWREHVEKLPLRMTVLDLRSLMPRATTLAVELGVNLLVSEALAAAEHLGAAIRVATDGALRRPAEVLGIDYEVVATT
jgi:hypothetical protein